MLNLGDNPYQPLPSGVEPARLETAELATASNRLGARIIDNVVTYAALIPGVIVAAAIRDPNAEGGDVAVLVAVMLGAAGFLGVSGYNWYRTALDGTTIGKRRSRIRVVTLDGQPPGFVRGVVLRSWVFALPALLGQLGSLVSLIDALAIFGESRRCIHDHVAGTRVIVA